MLCALPNSAAPLAHAAVADSLILMLCPLPDAVSALTHPVIADAMI